MFHEERVERFAGGWEMGLPGPYYQDDAVTIYHGDCREIVPQLGKFDLVLTDVPYGTESLGGGYGRRQVHSPDGRNGRMILGDSDLQMAAEGLRVSRAAVGTGYLGTFCAAQRLPEMFSLVPDAEYFGELIWDKGTPGLGYTLRYSHESFLLFKCGEPARPDEALLSVVRSQVSHVNTKARHPHEKPLNFWLNALRLPGRRVLDPFAGSGMVGRAAKDLGRECVLIEAAEEWCERAAERVMQSVLPLVAGPVQQSFCVE
jgi:hypothetical protein